MGSSVLISWHSIRTLYRAVTAPDEALSATEAASTIFRFFRSKHVVDFKLIFLLALVVLIFHIVIVLLLAVNQTDGIISGTLSSVKNYIVPAVPVYGVIVGWAYQSASARLGIVDLFACEISTLCRVGTIFDTGKRYVDQYNDSLSAQHDAIEKPPTGPADFVSNEDYFPIFDQNSRDLQLLEASVVSYITEFYTYMRATRDSLRRLAAIKPPEAEKPGPNTSSSMPGGPDRWHAAMSNVIFMLFLGYESGRKAVKELVEYEPAAAERAITILLTELTCYSFLLKHFSHDDLRYRRLKLREEDYRKEVPMLYRRVRSSHGANEHDWLKGRELLPELNARYQDAIGEQMATELAEISAMTKC